MCGFAGLFVNESHRSLDLSRTAQRMRDSLQHRGPDDSGIWVAATGDVAFGFRRLSILDLSALGHQPMASPGGRYVVMLNGEIFNFRVLRGELAGHGVTFRGHSDTEVLAAALDVWGLPATLPRLIGMFAIAIWDSATRQIHLVRDRIGKKPLFVYSASGVTLFASELKALAACPLFERRLETKALSSYLKYLYVPGPQSIYHNTRKVQPGHFVTVGVPGQAGESTSYWSLIEAYHAGRASPFLGTDVDAEDELQRILLDAVRLRMESDVPIGALLSGGVDSSLVTALMQSQSGGPIKTFSVGFGHHEHDESQRARAIAAHLRTEHTELTVSGRDALGVVPRLTTMFDEPLADPSQIPTFLVCELARREVTVALTGDGGDEVFAGYNRYLAGSFLIRTLQYFPPALRRLLSWGIELSSPATGAHVLEAIGRRPRLAEDKIAKLRRLLRRADPNEMYLSLVAAGWESPASVLTGHAHQRDAVEWQYSQFSALPLLDRSMLLDQLTYLPDDLLAKVDRASMAVSLEARVPLLDHRIVEFGWTLPSSMKVRKGKGKHILRQVLHRYVPQHLLGTAKVGFSVPLDDWLRGPLRSWAEDLFQGAEPPVNRLELLAIWRRFKDGEPGLALGLWAAAMFEAWRLQWRPLV